MPSSFVGRQRGPAGDHRSQLVPDTGDDHLEQMHRREQQQPGRGDEVQRARRLAPAEKIDPARPYRIEARRHRHAGHHHQRQQHEDHRQVGDVLQHVVALGRVAGRVLETQVVFDRAADAAQLAARGQQIARQVAAGERVQQVGDAVDDEHPGKEEVPMARHRQPLRPRHRGPTRKAARARLAIRLRHTEHAGGLPRVPCERGRADRAGRRVLDPDRQPRRARVGVIAPVQRRVRVEDVQTTHQQDRQADDVDPMHHAHGQAVAVEAAGGWHRRCGHGVWIHRRLRKRVCICVGDGGSNLQGAGNQPHRPRRLLSTVVPQGQRATVCQQGQQCSLCGPPAPCSRRLLVGSKRPFKALAHCLGHARRTSVRRQTFRVYSKSQRTRPSRS